MKYSNYRKSKFYRSLSRINSDVSKPIKSFLDKMLEHYVINHYICRKPGRLERMLMNQYVKNKRMQAAYDEGVSEGIELSRRINAQAMIDNGIDAEHVSKYTGLDLQEVLKLKKR